MARDLAEHGLQTIRSRHTCAHRVSELIAIIHQLEGESAASVEAPQEIKRPVTALTSRNREAVTA
jgi:hypothetical protein